MTSGTSTRGLMKGASKVEGLGPVLLKERRRDVALLRLRAAVSCGRPVCLSWHQGEHWVAVVGVLGGRYLIADAAENELVLSLGVDEVAAAWVDDGKYEGVIL